MCGLFAAVSLFLSLFLSLLFITCLSSSFFILFNPFVCLLLLLLLLLLPLPFLLLLLLLLLLLRRL